MANPVGILVAATGLVVSALGGLALGQYAVSGVDPTKAAAYASYADERYVARSTDTPDTIAVAYAEPATVPFDRDDTLY